jgi:hypothetical protein
MHIFNYYYTYRTNFLDHVSNFLHHRLIQIDPCLPMPCPSCPDLRAARTSPAQSTKLEDELELTKDEADYGDSVG